MDIWKSKVLPKIKLVFVKSAGKKAAAAAELVKSFDESKVSPATHLGQAPHSAREVVDYGVLSIDPWSLPVVLLVHIQEGIDGEFQEKKADLQPKVVEIYESAPAPLKVRTLVLIMCVRTSAMSLYSTSSTYVRHFVLRTYACQISDLAS
jgi:hypothetical protein